MPTLTPIMDANPILKMFRGLAEAAAQGAQNPTLKAGMEEGANYYAGDMRERFQSASHDFGGEIWRDITPQTKLKRMEVASGKREYSSWQTRSILLNEIAGIPVPILYITGAIYNSLVPGEMDNIMEADGPNLVYGSSNPIAHFHQRASGSRLPQRTILAEPDEETLEKIAESQAMGMRTLIAELAAA